MSFSFHPEAQTELEEAFEFYRENGGLELAKDFSPRSGVLRNFLYRILALVRQLIRV
jgi:hypothetical protein